MATAKFKAIIQAFQVEDPRKYNEDTLNWSFYNLFFFEVVRGAAVAGDVMDCRPTTGQSLTTNNSTTFAAAEVELFASNVNFVNSACTRDLNRSENSVFMWTVLMLIVMLYLVKTAKDYVYHINAQVDKVHSPSYVAIPNWGTRSKDEQSGDMAWEADIKIRRWLVHFYRIRLGMIAIYICVLGLLIWGMGTNPFRDSTAVLICDRKNTQVDADKWSWISTDESYVCIFRHSLFLRLLEWAVVILRCAFLARLLQSVYYLRVYMLEEPWRKGDDDNDSTKDLGTQLEDKMKQKADRLVEQLKHLGGDNGGDIEAGNDATSSTKNSMAATVGIATVAAAAKATKHYLDHRRRNQGSESAGEARSSPASVVSTLAADAAQSALRIGLQEGMAQVRSNPGLLTHVDLHVLRVVIQRSLESSVRHMYQSTLDLIPTSVRDTIPPIPMHMDVPSFLQRAPTTEMIPGTSVEHGPRPDLRQRRLEPIVDQDQDDESSSLTAPPVSDTEDIEDRFYSAPLAPSQTLS